MACSEERYKRLCPTRNKDPSLVLILHCLHLLYSLLTNHSHLLTAPFRPLQSHCSGTSLPANMGCFTRKTLTTEQPAVNTTAANGRHDIYSMKTRPKFGQWLKYTWLDILTMAVMGAVGLGVSQCWNIGSRFLEIKESLNRY